MDVKFRAPELRDTSLVLHCRLRIKSVQALGKAYPWERLQQCPACGGRLIGHGYVPRYFEGYRQPLWMKRYRCSECRAVHTIRPVGYWRKFIAPVEAVVRSLRNKIEDGCWVDAWSRQRQQYWWRGFRRRLLAAGFSGEPTLEKLWEFLRARFIVATHSLEYVEIRRVAELTNPRFAFTATVNLPYP